MTQFELQTRGFKEKENTGPLPFDPCLIMFTHPTDEFVEVSVTDHYDNTSANVRFRTSYPYPFQFKAIGQISTGGKMYLLFNHK